MIKRVKKANSLIYAIFRLPFRIALFLLYGFIFDMKTSKNIKRPCLILSNHQTIFDQFAVYIGFRFGINFIATDLIFRHGLLSKLMEIIGRPIPISKGSADLSAIKNIVSVIKEGGSIMLFPSGNRSFFGEECGFNDGIGKLAKKLKVPLVLVQLRGGYNKLPRWKVKPNSGKMKGRVSRIVSTEEMERLSYKEIDEIIRQEIRIDDFQYNKTAKIAYRGRKKAEFLESALFYCPQCGGMSCLASKGNIFFCRKCQMKALINDYGFFEKIENARNIPDTILEWSRLQLDYVKQFDFSGYYENFLFCDEISFYKAQRAKNEEFISNGKIALFCDRINICGNDFRHTDTTMAIFGARKMTVYHKDGLYTVAAKTGINLVKYMICGYHLRNIELKITEEYYGY